MQLVKNLYLKQYKTVARKVEEMIITWLIEENRLIPKERMYEIYLNIIEWGPGIYGAEEASRFYFNKGASELSLSEAIYLACIVPRPKKFFYLFDQEQHLRPWLQAYYRIIHSKMVRGMIDQQEQDLLVPGVRHGARQASPPGSGTAAGRTLRHSRRERGVASSQGPPLPEDSARGQGIPGAKAVPSGRAKAARTL